MQTTTAGLRCGMCRVGLEDGRRRRDGWLSREDAIRELLSTEDAEFRFIAAWDVRPGAVLSAISAQSSGTADVEPRLAPIADLEGKTGAALDDVVTTIIGFVVSH